MDSNQRFEQLKRKYQSVLDFMSREGVQLQNLNVQDGKLLIRGVAASEDLKSDIEERIRRLDAHFSEVLPDIRIENQANVPNTGQTVVQTSQGFREESAHLYSQTRRLSEQNCA